MGLRNDKSAGLPICTTAGRLFEVQHRDVLHEKDRKMDRCGAFVVGILSTAQTPRVVNYRVEYLPALETADETLADPS